MMITLGLSVGDIGGIGPEICLKSILALQNMSVKWVVFGPSCVKRNRHLQRIGDWPNSVEWVDTGGADSEYPVGVANAQNGRAIESMLTVANEWAMLKKIDALITAPISKTSLYLAGSRFTGHTTMLQALSASKGVSMGFFSPDLSVILATIHHPLMSVPSLLTPMRLKQTIEHAFEFTRLLHKPSPKIAIAGLNPHAGEGGLFGDEETVLLEPVISKMRELGYPVIGPLSPDTVFRRAYDGEFDLVIALYHDQGLIPLKLLAFEQAVNVTIGLPYLRVSPDHGTAYDIAYQGQASAQSLMAAIQFAIKVL